MDPELILAGDIGGTKTALALFERKDGGLVRIADGRYPSGEFPRLEAVLERFLAGRRAPRIAAAAFGVPGVVREGRAQTTNLPWPELDAASLADALGSERVLLLNDLEAAAYGMLVLPESELVELNPEAEARPRGNRAVIAAGTGLGEALLVFDGARFLAVATEGGHVDFAPRSDEEMELLRFLQGELRGRVSVERVLSGAGLHALYRFVRASGGEPEPAWLAERLAAGDPAAVVSQVAMDRRDAACRRALELFVSLYGAEAGNLALKCLAVGGVYLGGGIARKILPALREGEFLRAFADKGRFGPLLRRTSVRVATSPWPPLLGAAHRAVEEGDVAVP